MFEMSLLFYVIIFQRVENLFHIQKVVGSSPTDDTKWQCDETGKHVSLKN